MKKILITGITGFVGRYLTEHLKETDPEAEIFGVTRSLIDRDDPTFTGVTLLHGELSNEKDVANVISSVKPNEVYHLAALSSPADSFKAPTETITNNVSAQINVVEALRKHDLLETRIMIVTSSEVYGIVKPSDIPVDEKTSFNPGSPYAVSKITQDFLGIQYFHSYKMPIIRVRPFPHVGPRQSDRFVLSTFAKQIASIEYGDQEPVLKVGNLEAKRDFTDVRDIVRAYTMLMKKGVPGDVYNVGSGKSHKIIELLNMLLKLSKVEVTTKVDPERMRPSDLPELRCNYAKLHDLTGWKPEIPLEESIEDVLHYWRENLKH